MNDFTSWLYAHYIKPYLDECPRTGYETALDLRNDLVPYQNQALDRAVEFYASRAFLLGVRTGVGLKGAVCGL